jgi:hypothetical protein
MSYKLDQLGQLYLIVNFFIVIMLVYVIKHLVWDIKK